MDIRYEDADLLVVNKPEGMVGASGGWPCKWNIGQCIVGALRRFPLGNQRRDSPGIVHRIDKDTSGLLIVAKNDLPINIWQNRLKSITLHVCMKR